jgi:hypothetical protein
VTAADESLPLAVLVADAAGAWRPLVAVFKRIAERAERPPAGNRFAGAAQRTRDVDAAIVGSYLAGPNSPRSRTALKPLLG